VLSVAAILLIR